MKNTITISAIILFTFILLSCASLEPQNCTKNYQETCLSSPIYGKAFCEAMLNSTKKCVASELSSKSPFYKDEFRIETNAKELYLPESVLPEEGIELYFPESISTNSPLGKEVGDPKISEKSINENIGWHYSVSQLLSDIDSTIYIINYHKKQFDIATSPQKQYADYTAEIMELSENMGKLTTITQQLQRVSENYLKFVDSPDGPRDRSKQLLLAAGEDSFKILVANELIASDKEKLEQIDNLRQKLPELTSASTVSAMNFKKTYKKFRESAYSKIERKNKENQTANRTTPNAKIAQKTNNAMPIPQAEEAYPEGSWKLPAGSVICISKELYSTQLKLVAAGERTLISGCGQSNSDYKAIILEHNIFTPSKIMLVRDKTTVWTDATFLKEGSNRNRPN